MRSTCTPGFEASKAYGYEIRFHIDSVIFAAYNSFRYTVYEQETLGM